MPLLAIVPALSLIFLMALPARAEVGVAGAGRARTVVVAVLLWGLLTVATTEVLGMVGGLRAGWLAVVWIGVFLVVLVGLLRKLGSGATPAWWSWLSSLTRSEWALLATFAVQLGALLVLAIFSPTNNVDSLLYHMARVVHWAQDGSLRFYPTGYEHQLFMPPLAEMIALQLRLLWGNDGLANLVQWSSFLGCIVGAFSLAAHLGANRGGRWLAAAFVASLPMAVLQSTSTQNDLVVSLWLIVLAHVVLWSRSGDPRWRPSWEAGAAVGLGLLTKSTFYIYSAPFLAWMMLPLLNRQNIRRAIPLAATTVLIAVLVNLGHWSRTLEAYGSIFGPSEAFEAHIQPPWDRPEGVWSVAAAEAQMVVRNFVTPIGLINDKLFALLEAVPRVFGPDFVHGMREGLWNHEDTAGNPIHVTLGLAIVLWTLIRRRREGESNLRGFASVVLAGYLLLPAILSYATSLFGLRFQIPFLVLAGPVIGCAVKRSGDQRPALAVSALALVLSSPWVLFNDTRPLIGLTPWITRTGSVLQIPANDSLFAMYPGQQDEYEAITNRIRDSACARVGLRIDSHDPEYLFWWLLDAPQSGARLESLQASPALARYRDPTFKPCAVICTVCGSERELSGLPLDRSYRGISLYLKADPGPP